MRSSTLLFPRQIKRLMHFKSYANLLKMSWLRSGISSEEDIILHQRVDSGSARPTMRNTLEKWLKNKTFL